jgi:hypothetical protein
MHSTLVKYDALTRVPGLAGKCRVPAQEKKSGYVGAAHVDSRHDFPRFQQLVRARTTSGVHVQVVKHDHTQVVRASVRLSLLCMGRKLENISENASESGSCAIEMDACVLVPRLQHLGAQCRPRKQRTRCFEKMHRTMDQLDRAACIQYMVWNRQNSRQNVARGGKGHY